MTRKKRQEFLASILIDLGMEKNVIETITGLSMDDLTK